MSQTGSLRGGLAPLLFPTSIAVVGASDRTADGAEDLRRLVAGGARCHWINPGRESVLGEPCYATVAEAPAAETAFLLVNHRRVEAAYDDAVAAGIRSLVMPGIGAEAGVEGRAVIERIAARAAADEVAVLGPNCMGSASPIGTSLWLGGVPKTFLPGHVSCVVQSGSIGEALLNCGPRIGFRSVASCGGELSRDVADLIGFYAADPGTRAVGAFLETVRRPEAFVEALARCAEAGKPVVCLKVGRSQAAARTALAHTGAIVGSARTFSAVLARAGAIEVDDFHEMLAVLDLLGRKRARPRGRRIAAVTESGGESSLLADEGERAGLPFEPLAAATAEALRAAFPNFTAIENPLDCWAIAGHDEVFPGVLRILREAGDHDILLAQVDLSQHSHEAWNDDVVRACAEATAGTGIYPVVSSLDQSDPSEQTAELARELDVALLRGIRQAVSALSLVAGWQPAEAPSGSARAPIDLADVLRSGALPEHESATALERYGVTFAARRRCATADEAAAAAVELGGRVVVKSDGPAHKQAAGGVLCGIIGAEGARAAAVELGGAVLVAEQVPAGLEVFCGMSRDPAWGPVLAVGLGGRAIEALALAAVAVAPLDEQAAAQLARRAPGLAQLASSDALAVVAAVLVSLSRLATDHPEIEEIDVNPLILSAASATAVDALVVCR